MEREKISANASFLSQNLQTNISASDPAAGMVFSISHGRSGQQVVGSHGELVRDEQVHSSK